MSTLVPGTVFGSDYRVLRPLSSGGMGAVYVVEQLSTGQTRALKIMLPSLTASEDLRRRFEQEARIGARIASEHVVQVIAAGVDPATSAPYLVMELLDGEDLDAVVRRRGALPRAEVTTIFEQLCHAIAAAHASGVVHRDLKPENVFLAKSLRAGADFTVKVLDFGIAKLVAESAGKSTGAMGSPMWLAPEQTERSAITPAADVWALGLIAFFLLTGRSFWRAANAPEPTVTQLLREVLFEELGSAEARAKEYGAVLPNGFDGWFGRCVVRDAAARYPDAATALLGLVPVLSPHDRTALAATPVPPLVAPRAALASSPSSPKPTSRAPLALGALAVVALALGIGLFAWRHSVKPSEPAPPTSTSALAAASTSATATASASASATPSASASPAPSTTALASDSVHSVPLPAPKPSNDVSKKMPVAVVSTLRVQGKPQPESISRGIHAALPRFRTCYEAAVKTKSALAGSIRIEMVVGSAGTVLPTPFVDHTWTTMNDPAMETCMLGVASSLTFPKPESPLVSVTATLSFDMR